MIVIKWSEKSREHNGLDMETLLAVECGALGVMSKTLLFNHPQAETWIFTARDLEWGMFLDTTMVGWGTIL